MNQKQCVNTFEGKETPKWSRTFFKKLEVVAMAFFVTCFLGFKANAQVTYSENFDASTGGFTGTFSSSSNNVCAGNSMLNNLYSGNTSGNLTSPNIGTADGTTVQTLTFAYKICNWSANTVATPASFGSFVVQYGASATGPWTTIGTVDATNHVVSSSCANLSFSFTPPAGALFMNISATWASGDYYLNIDNFDVALPATSVPPCATALMPADLATGVPVNPTLTWASASTATSYDVYLSTTTPATFLGNTTTTSFSPGVLSSNTLYYYNVVPLNSVGSATGCIEQSFTTGTSFNYCASTYANGGTSDGITEVSLGALTNNSGGNSASPYYTFFNTVTIPDLGQTTNADVSVTMGADGNQWAAVWIDFNQNGTFEASEGVVSTANAGSNGTTIITVPVPAGAVLGNTRMRVRGGNDSQLTTAEACGASSSGWGETEDYIVNITIPPSCSASNGLIATVSNSTTAQLDWDQTAGASAYNYEIRTSGAPGSGATGLVASANITDTFVLNSTLLAQTTYTAYVQTDCGVTNGTSVWSSGVTFTTPCATFSLPWSDDIDAYTATTNAAFDPTNCWSTTPANTTGAYRWNIGGSTGSGGTGATSANSGANFFFTEASSGSTGAIAELVSPVVDVTSLTTPALNFFLHMFGTQFGSLSIDVNDGTGWVNDVAVYNTGAIQAAQADPFAQQVINLGAFTTGTIQVRYRAIRGTGFSGDICIDDISIIEFPTCTFPTAPLSTGVTTTTVDLTWTENGSATMWNIEYGPAGFVQGTGTIAAAGSNPFTLTGLTGGTAYDFYVQADCGGSTSTYSSAGSFFTNCVTVSGPWLYDVEGETPTTNSVLSSSCWSILPAGPSTGFRWNVTGNGATPSSGTGATAAFSGTNFFYIEASSGTTGDVAELYSPMIDLSGLTTPFLEFYTHMIGAQITDLRVDVNDGSGWVNDVLIVSGPQQTVQADPFLAQSVGLGAYAGMTVQLRFRVISGGTFAGDVCIDDISVIEAPLCPAPSSLSGTVVTATSADIAWTENGTATTWTIEYGAPGFTLGTGTVVPATSNPFTVTGIPCGAIYDFYVTSDCGVNGTTTSVSPIAVDMGPCPCTGTPAPGATISSTPDACVGVAFDLTLTNNPVASGFTYVWESADDMAFTANVQTLTSTTETQNIASQTAASYYRCLVTCTASGLFAYSTPVQVTQNVPTDCYCTPVYTSGIGSGDLISQVEITGTTLLNNSGTATTPNISYTYYDPVTYPAANYTASLTAGNSYNVVVTIGSFTNQGVKVWIDYNDDGIFDASEVVGNTTSTIGTAFGTGTFPITLDCNPPLGTHRMRVREVWNNAGPGIDPCASYGWGETEDYLVTVTAAAACPAPSGLSTISKTETSIELGWALGCTETAWNVVYGTPGFDPMTAGTTVPVTNDTTTITGLTCGTAYDFYVMADCGVAGPSIASFVNNDSTSACPSLNLTALIEGYYDAGTGLMTTVIENSQFIFPAVTTNCDSITVELHDATSTLSVPVIAHSYVGVLQTDGTMSQTLPVALAGNSYYIVLKHRNAIQTWSAAPVVMGADVSHDFTVQANVFGGNVKLVNPGVYALYSGDINYDLVVDGSDYPVWEALANSFGFGYVVPDMNGDGAVDLTDYAIWEGNANAFIFVNAPF